ncbi:DUF445 family protein [Candidatus Spyradosoma sp. SGI.093]|uniref:DUF445 family protein n=1 Tax=Candidatus Spyradosoma sp. SGI.093 TaxID=3420583 RepID=UPI003D038057
MSLLKLALDPTRSRSARLFSAAEIVCRALCAVAAALYALSLAQKFLPPDSLPLGDAAGAGLTILLAGAVGYATNWLAIRLLFHPVRKRFGFLQGLIPQKQTELGEKIGELVANDLITPEMIAAKALPAVRAYLDENADALIAGTRDALLDALAERRDDYELRLVPELKKILADALFRVASPENVSAAFSSALDPLLRENSGALAELVANAARANRPEIAAAIRERAGKIISEKTAAGLRAALPVVLSRGGPLGGGIGLGLGIGDYLLKKFSDTSLIEMVVGKLTKPIADALADYLAGECADLLSRDNAERFLGRALDAAGTWLRDGAGAEKISAAIRRFDFENNDVVHDALARRVPEALEKFLRSDAFPRLCRDVILPRLRELAEKFLASDSPQLRALIAKFDVAEQVATVVREQPPERFEEQIDAVAAEQLGAIQVLGFVLGALVGAAQCLLL